MLSPYLLTAPTDAVTASEAREYVRLKKSIVKRVWETVVGKGTEDGVD